MKRKNRLVMPALMVALAAVFAVFAVLAAKPASASSHREAPLITEMPKVDGTDFYMFRSYDPARPGYVTLIANYLPLQDAYGGPNYFTLDPDALYRIHIDNTGDAVEDMTFQFRVGQLLRDLQIPVGGKNISVPLVNIGQIDTLGSLSPAQNVLESYTMNVLYGPVDNPSRVEAGFRPSNGARRFGKPIDNIGEKSIPDYESYSAGFVWDLVWDSCGLVKVFVGQRKEPFAVNLGEIFDLVNIESPLGSRDAEPNTLADKNVTTFALEIPVGCLRTNSGGPVISGWTTAALPRTRVLRNDPAFKDPTVESGGYVQVSRLGMPLVNEVVIGLKDKNRFNGSQPAGDGQFLDYVTNPTLPELLEILFGGAGVRAPNNFPRTDLVAAFLTGVDGLNKTATPAEVLRLNVDIAPTEAAAQNNLGVIGGDNAGFPNGRRPGDDVVDIELRVAMGLLCHAFPGVYCSPEDAPSGNLPFTDGTLQDASQFDDRFPYLLPPLPGSPNEANGANGVGDDE